MSYLVLANLSFDKTQLKTGDILKDKEAEKVPDALKVSLKKVEDKEAEKEEK